MTTSHAHPSTFPKHAHARGCAHHMQMVSDVLDTLPFDEAINPADDASVLALYLTALLTSPLLGDLSGDIVARANTLSSVQRKAPGGVSTSTDTADGNARKDVDADAGGAVGSSADLLTSAFKKVCNKRGWRDQVTPAAKEQVDVFVLEASAALRGLPSPSIRATMMENHIGIVGYLMGTKLAAGRRTVREGMSDDANPRTDEDADARLMSMTPLLQDFMKYCMK